MMLHKKHDFAQKNTIFFQFVRKTNDFKDFTTKTIKKYDFAQKNTIFFEFVRKTNDFNDLLQKINDYLCFTYKNNYFHILHLICLLFLYIAMFLQNHI